MVSSSAMGGTKRRKYVVPVNETALLSRRLTRLTKTLKTANPNHLETLTVAATTFNTTGVLTECLSTVSQGDNYNQRFGNKCMLKRIVGDLIVRPGSTSAAASVARLVIFRAGAGAALPQFAANVSSSPIIGNGVIQVYYDKMFSVAATPATAGYGTHIRINKKIKFAYKFGGTGAGTQTGESVYIYFVGDIASGTAAPTAYGVLDVFFSP